MIGIFTASAIVTGVGMCVVNELAATPETSVPGRIVLMTPGEIAWDGCDCGQFIQSLQADYPSSIFPQDTSQQTQLPMQCESPLAYQVLASIQRCVHGLTGAPPRVQSPKPQDLLADALMLEADAFVLRNAVECCLLEFKRQYRIGSFRVGRVDKAGPEGNCAAVVMQYWFSLT